MLDRTRRGPFGKDKSLGSDRRRQWEIEMERETFVCVPLFSEVCVGGFFFFVSFYLYIQVFLFKSCKWNGL